MSMPNTRFGRCARGIAVRRSVGVGASAAHPEKRRPPPPGSAGVTRARYRLFGVNTSWIRAGSIRGFDTRAAGRARKSSGSSHSLSWGASAR